MTTSNEQPDSVPPDGVTDPLQSLHYAIEHWIPANPSTGKPMSYVAVARWFRLGINGVQLRVQKVGRVVHVRKSWLDDFWNACAEELKHTPKPAMPQPTDEELAEVGL